MEEDHGFLYLKNNLMKIFFGTFDFFFFEKFGNLEFFEGFENLKFFFFFGKIW